MVEYGGWPQLRLRHLLVFRDHAHAHVASLRRLPAALRGGGTVKAEDMGTVVTEREGVVTVVKEGEKKEEPKAAPVASKG